METAGASKPEPEVIKSGGAPRRSLASQGPAGSSLRHVAGYRDAVGL